MAKYKNLFVNNVAILEGSKIPLISLVQLSQKIVWTNFVAARTKTVGGVRKSRFFTFCDFVKKNVMHKRT